MDRREFFASQDTIFQMMEDRGYDVSAVQKYSKGQYGDIANSDVILVFDKDGSKIAVIWSAPNVSIVGITVAHNLALRAEGVMLLIVPANAAGRANISAAAKSAITYLDKRIQIYCVKDLIINITKHILVPKHTLVPDDKVKLLVKTYGPIAKFNGICVTDPIVRYYGWKRGNVIKIERNDNRIVYRVVT